LEIALVSHAATSLVVYPKEKSFAELKFFFHDEESCAILNFLNGLSLVSQAKPIGTVCSPQPLGFLWELPVNENLSIQTTYNAFH
jgi:hypothetical protein